jgi:hypothetical protein
MSKLWQWLKKLLGIWIGELTSQHEDFFICLKPSEGHVNQYTVETRWRGKTIKVDISLDQSEQPKISEMIQNVNQWEPFEEEPSGDELKDFGKDLRELVFPTPNKQSKEQLDQLVKALAQAHGTGKNLRLHLVLNSKVRPPELLFLPWEYLYIQELDTEWKTGFLALLPFVSVIRQVDEQIQERSRWIWPFGGKFRILIVVSNPKDPDGIGPSLNVLPELMGVCDALQLRLSPRKVRIEVLGVEDQLKDHLEKRGSKVLPGKATISNLQKIIYERKSLFLRRRQKYDVLHYIGHGFFMKEGAGLVLEPEEGSSPNYLFAKTEEEGKPDLVNLLKAASIRLVVLNTCQQAAGEVVRRGEQGEQEELLCTARQLIEGGIPAVVANQCIWRDQSAKYFAEAFYFEWARYRPVDIGIREARQLLGGLLADRFDWGAPVLYAAQFFRFSFIKMLAAAGIQLLGAIIFLSLAVGLPIWWGLTSDIRLIFEPLIGPSWEQGSPPFPTLPPIVGNADLDLQRLEDEHGPYLRIICQLRKERGAYCQWGISWGILPFNLTKHASCLYLQVRAVEGIPIVIDRDKQIRQVRFQVIFRDNQGKGNEGSINYYEFPKGGASAERPRLCEEESERYYIFLLESNEWVPIRIPLAAVEKQGQEKVDLSSLHDLTIRIDSWGYEDHYKGKVILDLRPFSLECEGKGEVN